MDTLANPLKVSNYQLATSIIMPAFIVILLLTFSTTGLYAAPVTTTIGFKRIAIIPPIIEFRHSSSFSWSAADAAKIKSAESRDLQRELYFSLADYLVEDQHWDLQHFTDTNNRLAAYGYTVLQSWDLSTSELAELLGVDAILRVNLERVPASVSHLPERDPLNPELNDPCYLNSYINEPKRTRASIGLFDGESGLPYWTRGWGQLAKVKNKNKAISATLIRKLYQNIKTEQSK